MLKIFVGVCLLQNSLTRVASKKAKVAGRFARHGGKRSDLIARLVFCMVTIVVMGIPASCYLLCLFIAQFIGCFTHATTRLLGQMGRILSYVFLTPDIRKFNHHYMAPWTGSEIGNVFSIWDWMFGTPVYANTRVIQYGLDVMGGDEDLNFSYQMLFPTDKTIPLRS